MSNKTEIRGWSRILIMSCIVLFSSHQQAAAQRTMKGQYHIAAQGVVGADSRVPLGGELSFGAYQLNSYIIGWINVTPDTISLPGSQTLGYIPINVGADYMYRVAAS